MKVLAAVLTLTLLTGCAADRTADAPAPAPATSSAPAPAPPRDDRPLAGRVVVVDPGHQLGNRNFPEKIARRVPAGGFRKPCNTTGTATDAGYAEATFVWQVSQRVVRGLERLGARVILTRTTNSERRWGPCVDVRGRAGNRVGADLKLSIHADGSYAADAHGFHVIVAPAEPASRRLAVTTRRALRQAGFDDSTYTAGGDGLAVRRDLGTLNLSRMPAVMVELGNMRSSREARVMTRPSGRNRYAVALVRAVRASLG